MSGHTPATRPVGKPLPGRVAFPLAAAAFLNAVRRNRHDGVVLARELDVRDSTVPGTGDGITHFFTRP
ncbi:hypothetical protein [Streptomyces anulatus]|uniref:hypothetical protein n=1 Tax=Streptomyces anulatus TaxID=1892 RepID=UPI003F4A1FA2